MDKAMGMDRRVRKFLTLLLLILLSACNLPAPATLPPTAPATQPPYQPCAYTWATESLPELSAQLQAAIEKAGLDDVKAMAEAFGETCSTGQPGQPASFGAMETDYSFMVNVASLDDHAAMGARLEKILTVLESFPIDSTPGPQPGYVTITYQSGDNVLNLRFRRPDGEAVLAQGLRGAALFEALQNK